MGVFKDEKGQLSAARVFLGVWTLIVVWAAYHGPAEPFWPLAASVMIGLVSWAAGPRIAQYLAPQAGAAARATADAIKAKIQARRNPDLGFEETQ
jgi:hypothetical protein